MRGLRIWEMDWLRKRVVKVSEGRGLEVGDMEWLIPRELACTPRANKSHDIIAWQGKKSGLVRCGGTHSHPFCRSGPIPWKG